MSRESVGRRWSFQDHRLQSYDYRDGSPYFVTIYAYVQRPRFAMRELAAVLKHQWWMLPQRFSGVRLDRFVIMPDYVHFIVWIRSGGAKTPSLARVIQAYKSLSALEWLNYLRERDMYERGRVWQDGYYERLLRDRWELEDVRRYIECSPVLVQEEWESR